MWQEESSSEIHFLTDNIDKKIFDWKLVQVQGFEPRAFHSTIVIDRFLYIFGGLDEQHEVQYYASSDQYQ